MREDLLELFMVGVRRADPERAVAEALGSAPAPDLVLALGKAAVAMARPVLARHPGVPALVVTNPENAAPLTGARVLTGAHPVPDASSLAAGEALLAAAEGASEGQRVLVLISGGGSALAVAPVDGVSLEEKAEVSRLLLGAGQDIVAMNRVRQALSRLKGGGLARAAAPATVEALILSDVVGDDPSAIASGPTVPPMGPPSEAADTLRDAGLWDAVPASVRAALSRLPDAPVPETGWTLVGSNALCVAAMANAAPDARVDDIPLEGDVAQAAERVAAAVHDGTTTLWGGETTVVLRGPGRGGRNQELALRVALALRDLDRPWAFLSGGTDGRDGPTDAAGAIVDNGTLARMRAAGQDAEAALAISDSYTALDASGDLIRIGGTGTNVADLQILRVG